jgi:hypothetical protein
MTASTPSLKPPEIQFRNSPVDPHVESTGEEIAHAGARLFGRAGAVLAGLALMFIGLGLGVTMVLLPVGIPVGLAGLLLFLGGLFGGSLQNREFKQD